MHELVLTWYSFLGSLNAAVALPLRELAHEINLPLASAFLFGLIGATSPCQLTTNASAAAFLAKQGLEPGDAGRHVATFLLGKVAVYSLLGVLAFIAEQQLSQASIPAAVLARKILGPVMIVLGLRLLGALPAPVALGTGLSAWLEARAGRGPGGAFVLGSAFAFAFCPTLFLLFFGLTVPLMWLSPVGLLFPAVFAIGTVLPLVAFLAVVSLGVRSAAGVTKRTRRLSHLVPRVTGAVFLAAGLNDTLVYWLL